MARTASFSEEAARAEQDHDDGLAHLLQALQGDWLPAEAYVQGKIAFQLGFWIRAGDLDGHFKRYVVLFQRAPGADLYPLDGRLDVSDLHALEDHRLVLIDGNEGRKQGPMFVFVGQSSEAGQRVNAWAVRSLVWLAEFDEVHGGGMQASGVPLPLDALSMAALVRRRLVEDWKCVPTARRLAVGSDQDPDEMVERCSEILEVVAENGAPFQWRLFDDMQPPEIARRLHVYLGDESVGLGFSLKEGVDLGIERVEMDFRSLDLRDAPG